MTKILPTAFRESNPYAAFINLAPRLHQRHLNSVLDDQPLKAIACTRTSVTLKQWKQRILAFSFIWTRISSNPGLSHNHDLEHGLPKQDDWHATITFAESGGDDAVGAASFRLSLEECLGTRITGRGVFLMKVLTFDIEDWFHLLDNDGTREVTSWRKFESRLEGGVDHILEVLDECGQRKATFFCLGWVAERYPHVVRKISDLGYHVATHSYGHQLVYEQTKEQFREDLKRSIVTIEDVIGEKIDTYRAPGFSITEQTKWALGEMNSLGISVDCSVFPAERAHGGLPNYKHAGPSVFSVNGSPLYSFPINTKNILGKKLVYSGGGYFRLFPSPLINRFAQTDQYVMTYFHPRDFDNGQPMLPGLSLARRFKSYVGIKRATRKLKKLINAMEFTDVRSAVSMVNWNSAPTVIL